VHDVDVLTAALLHDAVEDHPAELGLLDEGTHTELTESALGELAPGGGQPEALAVLAGRFGPRVGDLVAAVTNPPWRPGRDENEQYREHVAASLKASPWARVIKASDFTDNAVGLIHTTGPRLERLAGKYAPLVPVLRELILRPDTPLDADVKERIATQLDSAAARFAAIWHGPDPDAADS